MGEFRFSDSPERLAGTNKWVRIFYFAKTFGWSMEEIGQLSAKEAKILSSVESVLKMKVQEDQEFREAQELAKKMAKERKGNG